MDTIYVLRVKVNKVTKEKATELVKNWLEDKSSKKRYVVTPNIEFILDAQKDKEFRQVLNEADLAIPDSSHLGWAKGVMSEKSVLKRLILLPGVLTPRKSNDTVSAIPGVDFMDALIRLADEKGFTVGFLGGKDMVAKKVAERLKKRYKNLQVVLAESGGEVDKEGASPNSLKLPKSLKIDLLFVAFGHVKQEKWVAKNLDKIPVKVAMGVGGAFDYLSGEVARAPQFMRDLGYEWLFRLIIQPWRIKRQIRLIQFIWLVLFVH